MGTTNSKKMATPKLNKPSNLTPLQNAVLYKKYTKISELLDGSDDVTNVSEPGPTLLHLALVQDPPKQFRLDSYYEYLSGNILTGRGIKLIRETVELLCSRGARLEEDGFKMNPLEAIYYSSRDRSSRVLVNTLTSYVSLTCTDLYRYSVCQIVYHHCEMLFHQKHNLMIMKSCNSEGKKHLFHSLLLCVKHGIEPRDIPGKLTPIHISEFYMNFTIHEPKGVKFHNPNIDCGLGKFDFLEYKLITWQRLWNLSDPLSYSFHPSIVGIIIGNIRGSNDIQEKSIELFEILITAWLQTPPYSYPRLSGEVVKITRNLLAYLYSVSKKPNWEGLVNVTKLNQLLHLLVNIMSVTDSDLSEGVRTGQLFGYYIHKLLICKYEDVHNLPFVEVDLLTKSLSKLFAMTADKFSYLLPLLDYNKHYEIELDKQDFLGFLARFDPDLNARSVSSGRTPLHDALLFGNIFLIQALLESGANPFTVDREGNSFIEQLTNIINSFKIGPARQLYEETRDQYIILNPPFPLFTLAANVIIRKKIPFDILTCQPRIHNMLLSYLPT